MNQRWPGLDGLVLLGLDGLLVAVWLLKGRPDVVWPMALVLLASAGWLAITRSLRRGPPWEAIHGEPRAVVAIPTHDNASSIADVVRAALVVHPHVWVIDDGSTDGSGRLAEAAGARVWTHPLNRGKGAALQTALDRAHEAAFTHVIAMDADGQHFPDDIPRFLEAVRGWPEAVICGVRDTEAVPGGSVWARRNSNFWVWVETGRRLGDTQSGFRAYPVSAVRALNLPPSRYEWEVEVLTRAVWAGVAVRDLPCRVYYPPREERVSSYRKVVDTVRVTWINAQLVVERILWLPRWLPPAPRVGWRGQHRGTVLGWRLLLGILRLFGRRACQVAVMPLPVFYWLVAGTLRRGLDRYLARRFPDAGPLRRSWLALRVMAGFAHSLVDRFALLLWGPDIFDFDRPSVASVREALYDDPRGVLLMTSHAGDPELAAAMLRRDASRRVHIVMYVDPDDPYQRLMREQMGDLAPEIIPLNQGGELASLAALRALRSGDVVAVKVDRVIDGRVIHAPFLGAPMPLPAGPLLLAGLSRARTLMLGCFREGRRYRIVATEPREWAFGSRADRPADLQRWATEVASVLESWVRQYPLQWYNFHDPWAEASPPAEREGSAVVLGHSDAAQHQPGD